MNFSVIFRYEQPTGKIPVNLGQSAEKVEKTPGLLELIRSDICFFSLCEYMF